MVSRAPNRVTSVPLGTPSSAVGRSSTARTMPIFAGDPVVTSTNHGSARNVICEPARETSSAASSASSDLLRRITPAAGRALPRVRASDATATPSIATVCTAANPTSTGRAPYVESTGPAMIRPSGIPSPQIVMFAVIAFARIAGGMRSVIVAWIVGLQIPFAIPLAKIAATSTGAPTSSGRIQSGSAWNGTDSATSRSPSMRSVRNRNEAMFPTMHPAPKPAKRMPATVACAS